MTTVRFDLLGPPDLRVDGEPVALETRKALAVLALVVVDGPQRRDALDALLWPASDAKRARAALRRTLKTLRAALPDGWLAPGDDVALAGPVVTDHGEVDGLVGDGRATDDPARLAAADALHRGGFLAGLHFRDADAFEHWRRDTAEQLARRHARTLERLCRVHVAHGALGEATAAAERRLALDPIHEPSHQQLMLLHAWRGDRAAAARQYATCVRVLDEELGVAPLPRTVALDRAVRDGTLEPPEPVGGSSVGPDPFGRPVGVDPSVAADPRGPGAGPSAGPSRPELVGREDELATLLDLHGTCDPDGAFALVTGEPGIGRTRLVDEVAGRVGGSVLRLVAHPGEGSLAYAPVATALRSVPDLIVGLDEHVRQELARLVPDVAGVPAPPQPLTGPGARTRFVDACATALAAAATVDDEQPGLLVVDDLDRTDPETREVVAYLARRLVARPLLVLATVGEEIDLPAPDVRIGLSRLSEADVARLADAAGAADAADRLHAESEGVPFLVVAYLAALAAGETAWDLPADARALVRNRLLRLDDVARQVLAAAAVLGGRRRSEVLQRVSGRSEDEVVEAVESLTAEGLLEVDEEGTCALTHDKVRATVVADTSHVRRRLLHRRAAEALRTSAAPVDAAELAHHLAAAGMGDEAATAHAEAGRRAAALWANEAALDHLDRALALGGDDPDELLLALGDLLVRTGRYAEAADRYVRAAAHGVTGAVVEHRLGALALRRGDDALAEAHLLAALGSPASASHRVVVLAELAAVHVRRADLDAASARAEEAVAVAADVPGGGADVAARARNVAGLVARHRGELGAAREHLRASLAAAAAADRPDLRASALNNLALVLGEDGDLDRALVLAGEALEAGRLTGDRHREAALLSNLADLLHADGRTPEALDLQASAAERFAGVGEAPVASPWIWRLVDW